MVTLAHRRSALERSWTSLDAEGLYRLGSWGKGYFAINEAGHYCGSPGSACSAGFWQ